jgi:hypothetical protein
MAALKTEIAAMGTRLDLSDGEKTALGRKVQQLNKRLNTPGPPPPPPSEPAEPAEPPPPAIDPVVIDFLRASVQQVSDRMAELDGRITSISTELANQINELSGEIDGLGGDNAPSGETVEVLRDAQVKLANEQARYQISFRQDLAEIADRLKGD